MRRTYEIHAVDHCTTSCAMTFISELPKSVLGKCLLIETLCSDRTPGLSRNQDGLMIAKLDLNL